MALSYEDRRSAEKVAQLIADAIESGKGQSELAKSIVRLAEALENVAERYVTELEAQRLAEEERLSRARTGNP